MLSRYSRLFVILTVVFNCIYVGLAVANSDMIGNAVETLTTDGRGLFRLAVCLFWIGATALVLWLNKRSTNLIWGLFTGACTLAVGGKELITLGPVMGAVVVWLSVNGLLWDLMFRDRSKPRMLWLTRRIRAFAASQPQPEQSHPAQGRAGVNSATNGHADTRR